MGDATGRPPPASPPPPPPPCSSPASTSSPPAAQPSQSSSKPLPPPAANPALRMLGLPNLPRKLPSRNWLIFWTVSAGFASAVVYDKREKKRATAKWRRLVEPLSREPVPANNQLSRRLTIFLEAPPGDGLRVAQDHFIEYVKPVLAVSGLDWDFVQGRQQGDVRAAVAEKIRRVRKAQERPDEKLPQTDESLVDELRAKIGVRPYQGVKGDIVIGRHTWKEYVRGLHEGWLGPLDPPPQAAQRDAAATSTMAHETPESTSVDGLPEMDPESGEEEPQDKEAKPVDAETDKQVGGEKDKPVDGEKDKPIDGEKDKPIDGEKDKPARPSQMPAYNSPADYDSASLPMTIPDELSPCSPLPFPHRLGFSQTFVRLGRFLNRRKLADDIGREVAAVCLGTRREWRDVDGQAEQQAALEEGEKDWPKSTWQDSQASTNDSDASPPPPPGDDALADSTWTSRMVLDGRIAARMRRFEMQPQDEARAEAIVVPEEEIERWIKSNLRSLCQWGVEWWRSEPWEPNVGSLDDDDDGP